MLGAMLYVNAGKGHYVPAKALADGMERNGHNAVVEDMFLVIKSPFWEWYCKHEWRFLLHHPRLERIVHHFLDNRLSGCLIRYFAVHLHTRKDFVAWYNKTKPDFIVCTNFLGGNVITPIVRAEKLDVPVYIYVADVFNNPEAGFNKDINKLFVATYVGQSLLLKKGYAEQQVKVCPFPLQSGIQNLKRMDREEAKQKLGLKQQFTLLLNFGGEGIGNPDLLKEIARRSLPWQIVVVGNLTTFTRKRFEFVVKQHPFLTLHTPGFVSNIGDYMLACDVQAGKAGANALMESMALHRPFLISELLHAARDTQIFLSKHQVGWVENNIQKQVDILEQFYREESSHDVMDKRFSKLPLSFDSDKFIAMLLEETENFHTK